jgi:hypothetical protein
VGVPAKRGAHGSWGQEEEGDSDHVEVEPILVYKSGPGYFDLAQLIEKTPRLHTVRLYWAFQQREEHMAPGGRKKRGTVIECGQRRLMKASTQVEPILVYKSGPGYFDLAQLIEKTPRLHTVRLYHSSKERSTWLLGAGRRGGQ